MRAIISVLPKLTALIAICIGSAAFAQKAAIDLEGNLERNDGRHQQTNDGNNTFELAYRFEPLETLSGGSFQVRFDNSILSVSDSSDCLSGLPDSHQSGYSVCNVFEDKGIVQFIILDVGRNRPVGSDFLGSIVFAGKKPFGDIDPNSLIEIGDVRLAGPDGRHLTVSGQKEKYVHLTAIQE